MIAPHDRPKAYALLLVILLVGFLGVALIMLLITMWRRYNARQQPSPPRNPRAPMPDIWQAAADRLDDVPPPQEEPSDAPDDTPDAPTPPR